MSQETASPSQPSPASPSHGPQRDRRWVAPTVAVLLIVVGFVAFMRNFGVDIPDNWGGLLLLIPAAGCLVAALRRYRTAGASIDGNTAALFIAAAVFALMFVVVFFRLDQNLFGPLVVMAVGAGILARHYWRG